jgi:hypothetical protein
MDSGIGTPSPTILRSRIPSPDHKMDASFLDQQSTKTSQASSRAIHGYIRGLGDHEFTEFVERACQSMPEEQVKEVLDLRAMAFAEPVAPLASENAIDPTILAATLRGSGAFDDDILHMPVEESLVLFSTRSQDRSVSPADSAHCSADEAVQDPDATPKAKPRTSDIEPQVSSPRKNKIDFLAKHMKPSTYTLKGMKPEDVAVFQETSKQCKATKLVHRYPEMQPRFLLAMIDGQGEGALCGKPEVDPKVYAAESGQADGMGQSEVQEDGEDGFIGNTEVLAVWTADTEEAQPLIARVIGTAVPSLQSSSAGPSTNINLTPGMHVRRNRKPRVGMTGYYTDAEEQRTYEWCRGCKRVALHRFSECQVAFPKYGERPNPRPHLH